ncbi:MULTISPECIES: thioredoxin domain-containing protein [Derxia]|uniref:Thioredoxin domain-containing protein n=1 Tax=Derxia gummosa DSM 723 TaxID=1121388 RepID=A0A8B6X878_9BURK|nr:MULTISPECIES: thioredoxin domain-containing protein [Derxia]
MPNRLAHETSPYLLQHADNPVDWHPWGQEALDLAVAENKPILLSIGYSACHWCHVMAHESFEDADTAALMNRLFVNIKVDREERPDLDDIYQHTLQLMTRRAGGWPLTVLLTPAQVPFFAGTYFPPEPRHNLPSFRELLTRAEQFFRSKPEQIAKQAAAIRAALTAGNPQAPAVAPVWTREPIDAAVEALRPRIDSVNGGFGNAPKFPQPHLMGFLLEPLPEAMLHALGKMAEGGVYDHLGGGFFRYSVDAHWTIPHFEKMLYDNGPLLGLYAEAWTMTGDPAFARVCDETVGWLLREMRAPDGGFFSALDADSEGEEGKFYVWTPDEIAALVEPGEFAVLRLHYDLAGEPNFEGAHWHLRIAMPLDAVARQLGIDLGDAAARLASARRKLFAAREQRVRPGLDDKILTAWNGLTIKGLAKAARVFGRADWLAAARGAMDFLRERVWVDGRLYTSWKAGVPRHNGYLADYAFVVDAALELMQAGFRRVDLDFALELADALLARFEDKTLGGFWFTSHDHERLIHRGKPADDSAIPSGNGIAVLALQRLAALTGEMRFADAARRALALFHDPIAEGGQHMPCLTTALGEFVDPVRTVVLRAPAGQEAELARWQAELARRWLPHTLVVALGAGATLEAGAAVENKADAGSRAAEAALPATLDKPLGAGAQAWVCEGALCRPPVDSLPALVAALGSAATTGSAPTPW